MFLSTVRSEAVLDRSPGGDFWFQPIGLPTASGVRVTSTGALGVPEVWACVNVLAKSFAMMPFELFEPQQPRGRKKRRDHWLWRLIAKRPNRYQTPFEWKLMLMGHLALRGNAFCQIEANGRGEITELLPLHPDRMQAEVLPSGNYRYVYTDQQGRRITYMRGEIWHLRWMSGDGIVGYSPIELQREAIGESIVMRSYAARFFANDARPGGWIEFDGKFGTDDARKTFKKSWQENYSGRNLRKVAVLEKGMKYHELALKNSDLQFVEGRREKAAEIPRIWGIPPHKIGVLDKATLNNIEQQNIEFWTDTMTPWGKMWSDSLEFFLLGADSGLDAEFDAKPMMRGDGVARSTRIRSLVLAGVMLRNEGREEEGYDPVDGLDVPLVPVNMATVDEDGEIHAIASNDRAVPAAPDDGSGERGARAAAGAGHRLDTLLAGNASRMARRLAKGERLPAEALAAALAIDEDDAAAWLATADTTIDETALAESLLELALLERT